MKIEIIKDKFIDAVTQAERVSGKHVSLPVLSSVIIEAFGSNVVVRATNLDVGVEITIPAKVEKEGVVAIPNSLIKAFLGTVGQGKNIILETNDLICKVVVGQNEAIFNTVSPDDFPVIPKITSGKNFTISAKEFLSGLKSVLWSSAVSTIKPELSSVYIYEDNDDLVFVATDSFRLAERRIKAKKIRGFDPILIPFKNALEIVRVFELFGGELQINISKNQLSVTTDDIHLSSRVVDGTFPDYRQIIPKEFHTEATVLKQDFSQALKLSSLFSDSLNQVTISLDVPKKTLGIFTKNNEVGESRQVIKGAAEGESITMSFNHRYIFDCLQSIDGESIILKIAGAGRPMLITPASHNSFTYLVMSMNR